MKRKLVVCLLAGTLMATPVFALLGIGDVVFDPSNYAEAIAQLVQLEQQYEQLVRTYQMVRSQYDHMVMMAKQVPVDMTQRYRAVATPLEVIQRDQYLWIDCGVDIGDQYGLRGRRRICSGDAAPHHL